MKRIFLTVALLWMAANMWAAGSLQELAMDEVRVESTLKESGDLRSQPASVTHIGQQQMSAQHVLSVKNLGTVAPNVFIPDYGSRQTSAVYVRGIGSRIGTPAVGLYVDNVPYYDKAAFDFMLYEVESLDILRGPQNTLYGRNVMGGVIKVNTYNPFEHVGTDIRLGFSTRDSRRRASATHYHRISEQFAFSAGGYYSASDGVFRNSLTGDKADAFSSGGGRIRAIFKPSGRLTFDAAVGYEYSDESAYPYFYTGATSGEEAYADLVGTVSANLDNSYRRGLFTSSVNTEYRTDRLTLHAVTAYQDIDDRMFMDQDFLAADIYSLEQRQHIRTLSEEIILKNAGDDRWSRLTGVNLFYQWHPIVAPVTFRTDGVAWLNALINDNANLYMNRAIGSGAMQLTMSDRIQGDRLPFCDDFEIPFYGMALFHQSGVRDLFGLDGLSLTAGLRLDYERNKLRYAAWYDFEHVYELNGYLAAMNRVIPMVPAATYPVNGEMGGRLSDDYLQVSPKLALTYVLPQGNVYAVFSRGYRSGGYNVQNISELMRTQMQSKMMGDVYGATMPVLQRVTPRMVSQEVYDKVDGILSGMAAETEPDVTGTCAYKPEYAWHYEAGTHLQFFEDRLTLDGSVFFSTVRDLQLSKMSRTGLGRSIVNAGRSRSLGAEAAVSARPTARWAFGASYGFTQAVFRDYRVYTLSGEEIDCRGCHVPYMPMYTALVDVAYTLPLSGALQSVTFGADWSATGRIWWNEQNTFSQPSYGLLGARAVFTFGRAMVQCWARNLTDKDYDTFWFESMDRGFAQRGLPVQAGIDVRLHL
ncbi:MAG: TonB-dependent receptor [Bacteroidales bacterium]|nr:TonB-dependent receptor [Bacteroidales bacterium]